MKKLNFKLVASIVLVTVLIVVVAVIVAIKKQPATTKTTTSSTSEDPNPIVRPPQPIDYPADKPVIVNSKIYFVSKDQLRGYDLATKKDAVFDFPTHEDTFEIGSITPLSDQVDAVVVQLDNLNNEVKQLAVFDLQKEQVTTKFVDRLKAVAWQIDQQKLLAYAISTNNEPFFLTTSLDAKNQKAIIKTKDTDVMPLMLTDQALIYASKSTLKKIDLEKKEESVLVENISDLKVTNDGSAIAYITQKGLFALTKDKLQTISLSRSAPSFLNWSNHYLMFGTASEKTVSINRWNSKTKQLLTRTAIALTDIVTSVQGVFEDISNNQLIYWSDGFLYSQALTKKP